MSTPAIETTRPIRPARPWIIVATLCILAAGALWFIEQAARQYSVYDAVNYGDLWPRRGGLIPHVAGGHREWMIRSYTVTFAFVLFRLVDQLLTHWHVAPDDQIDAMTAWACWSVPLLLVEPPLQFRKARRGALH